MEDFKRKVAALAAEITGVEERLDLIAKRAEIAWLREQTAAPDFWQDAEAATAVSQKLARLETEVEPWNALAGEILTLTEMAALDDTSLLEELQGSLAAAEARFVELKKALRFTGKYDHGDAILRITSGVGGTEAMDWAGMLERMYLRFAERRGFKVANLERTVGEEAGIKTAVYEITGADAYGWLKSEHGVHRLVRLSPFNADHLRQTSFALVEVLPVLDEAAEIELPEKDLRIDVYHSGGHGGQSVNTTNSAVRITHLPTGLAVAIQNERSQLQNKAKAMEILRGKLAQMQQEQQAESLDQLRAGESAKWGQQIRNYVLQPYKLVKDTRTKCESKDPDAVLDGALEPFMEAFLEQK